MCLTEPPKRRGEATLRQRPRWSIELGIEVLAQSTLPESASGFGAGTKENECEAICAIWGCIPEWLPDRYGVEYGPSERKCRRCKRFIRPGMTQPMQDEREEQAWVKWRAGKGPRPVAEPADA